VQGRITGRQEGGGRGKGKAKTIWSLVSIGCGNLWEAAL
jgi:hypothetical protein